eukprot:CAMPEP_0113615172 /NCGR_PEP_ID=MMETSP0017_2-20120614/7560_1 /TAXON_ID=2856 /ORGANISM="Cylindrotheca closterium" /LENGTH=463 /DNA_ID=CAMNT_0000524393 /DNA_START=75 /DNA_END=1466 /DNA_ORIENTATION=+ /assembly_acc=CAM_ASM_000147
MSNATQRTGIPLPPDTDYLVIVDFEATCNDNGSATPNPQEIIEFPAVLLNVKTGEVEDEFHHYILPDVHPKLSSFCTELTGITQETVDQQGISLKDALDLHYEWINKHNLTNDVKNQEGKSQFLYVTCGDWDFKTCLPNQLAYHNQTVPQLFSNWINIKKVYGKFYNRKARGMTTILNELDLKLEGRHHSGIDDSRNITRICARMLEDGWKPSATTRRGAYFQNANALQKKKQKQMQNNAQKQKQKKKKEPIVIQDKSQCKTVFLIRHGQSEGQAARKQRKDCYGEEFTDCGLTAKGYKQAEEISDFLGPDAANNIDLVISSPLRRALHTAVLGFMDQDILVHYDLCEIGSRIPENMPLPMGQVLKSLKKDLRNRSSTIDTESLQPKGWPDNVPPRSISKKERIENAFRWLYHERSEKCIAVVCHYNVIRSMLMQNTYSNITPQNAMPIKCLLTPEGHLVPEA